MTSSLGKTRIAFVLIFFRNRFNNSFLIIFGLFLVVSRCIVLCILYLEWLSITRFFFWTRSLCSSRFPSACPSINIWTQRPVLTSPSLLGAQLPFSLSGVICTFKSSSKFVENISDLRIILCSKFQVNILRRMGWLRCHWISFQKFLITICSRRKDFMNEIFIIVLVHMFIDQVIHWYFCMLYLFNEIFTKRSNKMKLLKSLLGDFI